MKNGVLSGLVGTLALLSASAAQGVPFTSIQYSLAGSNLVVNAPLAGSAPVGGTMTVALEQDGVGNPKVSGSVQVLTFNFVANPLTIAFVTGSVQQVLLSPISNGHLTTGHAVLAPRISGFGATGLVALGGFLHCQNTTAICQLAALPASIPVPLSGTSPHPIGPITTPVNISPLQFNSLGGFNTFTQARGFILGTNTTGTIFLTGSEISRTTVDRQLVPEPGTAALLALGLVLVGISRTRTRRKA